MKKIKKVAITELPKIEGSIVDGINIDDKITNTYSANVIDGLIDEKITSFHNTKKIFMGCDYLGVKKNDFDLNNLKAGECCYYFANNNSANLPVNYPASTIGCNYMVYSFNNITDYGSIQIAFPDGSAENNRIYIRYRWGSSWTGWLKITASA